MGKLRVSHWISPGPAAIPRVRVDGIPPSRGVLLLGSRPNARAQPSTVRRWKSGRDMWKRGEEEGGNEEEEEGVKYSNARLEEVRRKS